MAIGCGKPRPPALRSPRGGPSNRPAMHQPPDPTPPRRPRANWPLAFARLAAVLALTAWHSAGVAFDKRRSRRPRTRHRRVARRLRAWGRRAMRLAGIRLRVRGVPKRGALLAPNHVGYGDVVALCAAAGCAFVPKAELFDWPVVGPLMRLTDQVGIERSKSRGLASATRAVEAQLREGATVAVFLEGTTTRGDRVLAYRPSFVQAAIDAGAPVQPVAITWRVDRPGLSVARDVAYWGDAVFLPHFVRFLGLSGIEVRVRFGEPIPATAGSRKAIAALARERAARMARLPLALDTPEG